MAYIIVIRNGTNANDVEINMNSPKNMLQTKGIMITHMPLWQLTYQYLPPRKFNILWFLLQFIESIDNKFVKFFCLDFFKTICLCTYVFIMFLKWKFLLLLLYIKKYILPLTWISPWIKYFINSKVHIMHIAYCY